MVVISHISMLFSQFSLGSYLSHHQPKPLVVLVRLHRDLSHAQGGQKRAGYKVEAACSARRRTSKDISGLISNLRMKILIEKKEEFVNQARKVFCRWESNVDFHRGHFIKVLTVTTIGLEAVIGPFENFYSDSVTNYLFIIQDLKLFQKRQNQKLKELLNDILVYVVPCGKEMTFNDVVRPELTYFSSGLPFGCSRHSPATPRTATIG